ncbi:MAG: hypothetical protein WBQ69_07835, partial [Gallionella sp.]
MRQPPARGGTLALPAFSVSANFHYFRKLPLLCGFILSSAFLEIIFRHPFGLRMRSDSVVLERFLW